MSNIVKQKITTSTAFPATVLAGESNYDLRAGVGQQYIGDGTNTWALGNASWVGKCRVATAATLPANTYSGTPNFTLTATANAALTVDGIAVALNDRVLVKNEATAKNNGVYYVTAVGSAGAPYVLTRVAGWNFSGGIVAGAVIPISEGTANANTAWQLTTAAAITLDTTSLNFGTFGSMPTGTTNRITVTSGVIDISSNYVGQSTITTLGTVATGTWQATAVGVLYGGTGATTASGARSNLSAAVTGANGDITSLTGITGAIKAPTGIQDSSSNNCLTFSYTASAVDYIQVKNAATANPATVEFDALGSDSNVNLNLVPKGTGKVQAAGNTVLDVTSTIDCGTY